MRNDMEKILKDFAEGNLSPEAQVDFDKRFETDPEFSSSAVKALGERLGPAPEAFLDKVAQKTRPDVEAIFKQRFPVATEQVPSEPGWLASQMPLVGVILGVILLAGVGTYVATHRSAEVDGTTPVIEATGDAAASGEPSREYIGLESEPRITASPIRGKGHLSAKGGAQEGTAIRIQNLPADSSVSIDILNGQGRLVRRLYQGPWSPDQKLDWDGLDAAGKAVPSGAYRARVITSHKSFVSEFTVQ